MRTIPCPICGREVEVVGELDLGDGVRAIIAACLNSSCTRDDEPPTLSTGQPSTLRSYRENAVRVFGEFSPAVRFLDGKIAESDRGADEPVLADEAQVIYALGVLHDERVNQS